MKLPPTTNARKAIANMIKKQNISKEHWNKKYKLKMRSDMMSSDVQL